MPVLKDAKVAQERLGIEGSALLPPRPSGMAEFQPEDFETPEPFFSSVSAAFQSSGIITGGVSALRQPGVSDIEEPGFDVGRLLEDRTDLMKVVQPFLDANDENIIGQLIETRSTLQAEHLIRQLEDAVELQRRIQQGSGLAFATGTVAGIGLDILAGLGIAVAAPSTIPGLAVLRGSSVLAGRGFAAGRLGVAGAVEGAGERFIQGLANPLITNQDVLVEAGLGATLGVALGAVFPRVLGGVAVLDDSNFVLGAATGDTVAEVVAPRAARPVDSRTLHRDVDKVVRGKRELEYRLTDADGENILTAEVDIDEDTVRIIGINSTAPVKFGPNWQRQAANTVGHQDLNRLILGIAEDAPGVKRITGERISGIRHGGIDVGVGAGVEVALPFAPLLRRAQREAQREFAPPGSVPIQPEASITGGSVGAAAATRTNVPGTGAGSAIPKGSGPIAQTLFRNPKRIITDIGVRGKKLFESEGLTGARTFFDKMSKLTRISISLDVEELGKVGRQIDAETFNDILQTERLSTETLLTEAFNKAHKDLFPSIGALQRGLRNQDDITTAVQGLGGFSRSEFGRMADEWAIARGEGRAPHELGIIPERLAAKLSPDQLSRLERHLEASSAQVDAFYQRWGQLEVEAGLITPKQLIKGYRPQRWNKDELANDSLGFEHWLYMHWAGTPDTEWLELSGLANKGEDFFDLRARNLEAAEEALDEWSLKVKRQLEERKATTTAERRLELDDLIARASGAAARKAERAAIKKAEKAVSTAEKVEQKIADAPDVLEQVRQIRQAIMDGDNPFGLIDDALTTGSARLKQRNIRLGNQRFSDTARRFLHTNAEDNLQSYSRSIGPRLALKRVFGEENPEKILKGITDEYDSDIRAAQGRGNTARVAELQQLRANSKAIAKALIGRFLNHDIGGLHSMGNGMAMVQAMASRSNAITMLHSIVLSQIPDLVIANIAGGRLGMMFRGMFGGKSWTRLAKALSQDSKLAEIIIRGPSVIDASRFRDLTDLDPRVMNLASGKLQRVLRTTDKVAVATGWINLMHGWNRMVRGSFGIPMAKYIGEDLPKFASLPTHRKRFYARVGIGEDWAPRLAQLLKDKGKTIEGIRVPDFGRWATENPEALEKWQQAFMNAGDEAMVAPGFADMPFLKDRPLGALVLQFQSFMFTLADRVLSPAIQELRLGNAAPFMILTTMGVALGAMSQGLREHLRGNGEEWDAGWNDERINERIYSSLIRSPLMVGPSSTLSETLTNAFGRHANEALGTTMIPQAATRFRELQSPMASLLGPSVSQGDRLVSMGQSALEGDYEKLAKQARTQIPIVNSLAVQALAKAIED